MSLFLSLSLFFSLTQKEAELGETSFREKLLMIPITIILMEIIIMTVRIIVLILFVFKTPFYFVCLLHVRVTLVPTPSCNSVENVFVPFFIFGIKRRKKIYKICYNASFSRLQYPHSLSCCLLLLDLILHSSRLKKKKYN